MLHRWQILFEHSDLPFYWMETKTDALHFCVMMKKHLWFTSVVPYFPRKEGTWHRLFLRHQFLHSSFATSWHKLQSHWCPPILNIKTILDVMLLVHPWLEGEFCWLVTILDSSMFVHWKEQPHTYSMSAMNGRHRVVRSLEDQDQYGWPTS